MTRLSLLLLLSNGTRQPLTTPLPTEAPYNHGGAFWFVATVMTVYAMAILFMIMSHINRRGGKREMDREVNIFLRSAPTVRIEEERQRRRNLKRAMQPFIRMAMDKRTIGVHVSIADDSTGDALTQTSIETLAENTLELLPASDRVVKSGGGGGGGRGGYRYRLADVHQSRRLSASSRGSSAAASVESGWQSGSLEDLAALGGCGHSKAVQCGLDPRQTLASRTRWLLTSVPSEAELGASASSQKMEMLMLARQSQQQQQLQQKQQQQQQRMKSVAHSAAENDERLRVSASQTHVPRFLAVGTGPKGAAIK